jgi:hypothetical protein
MGKEVCACTVQTMASNITKAQFEAAKKNAPEEIGNIVGSVMEQCVVEVLPTI